MIRLTPPTLEKFVNSTWGRPRPHRSGSHEGLDLPTKVGSPILAAADGEVVKVDNIDNSLAGKHIVLHHGSGMHSRYLHNKTNLVKVGDRVKRGQKIATAGTTGTTGRGTPHLHFDLKFQPSAHAAYEARYGQPKGGWGGSMGNLGRGVPAETFMSGVTYSDASKRSAKELGVVFYKGGALLGLGILAAAAYLFMRKKR